MNHFNQVSSDVDKRRQLSGDDQTTVCDDASLNGMRRKIAGKTRVEIKTRPEAEISKDPVLFQCATLKNPRAGGSTKCFCS